MHGTPTQEFATTTTTEVGGGRESGDSTKAVTAVPSPDPVDTVYLCKGNRVATPADLFDMKKRNIRVGSTTYTCSFVTVTKGKPIREITKVFCCSMVSSPQGWVSKPSFRVPKNALPTDPRRCQGKLSGHFKRTSFYFSPHGTIGHACQLQHGGIQSKIDLRPPMITITAPPSWGITDTVIAQMIAALQSCSEKWWEPLPKQG